MLKLTLILIAINNINGIENISHQTHEDIILYATTPEETNYSPNYLNKKEENARRFLQQYNSLNPVVLLIEDTQQSQNEAANFVTTLYKLSPKVQNVNFMIMKFNASGASPVLETTANNKHRFEQILNERIIENPSNFLGRDNSSTSAVFFGILNAVQVVPPNSGVVIFMKKGIEDETLAQHALLEVAKKRIQVFVIWGGKEQEHLLKELAMRSRGAFLVTSDRTLSEVYYEKFLENIDTFTSMSMILSRKNLEGEHNLLFPIDSDVTGIHISITPNISKGILTTPRGYNIDVLRGEDVSQFSVGSFINRHSGMHEIHLNTTTAATQDVGVWRLRVGNARALYDITIFAHTKLTTNAVVTVQNLTGSANKTGIRKRIVKLGVTGDVSSISNISFVTKDGQPILSNVKFTLDKNWENYLTENIDSVETNEKKELNINVEELPKEPFYAVVDGKDSQGNDFRRLSYVQDNIRKEFYLPPLTVEVGLGSELITQPFRQPQLFFEVTNNGKTPTFVRFFCRDEKGILLSMVPWYRSINPQETATVRVSLTTRPGSYQDLITFTAAGSETVTKNVIVDVGTPREDRRDPVVHHQFTSDCMSVLLGSCEDGTWTVEVKAKDVGSGLLQVSSIPRGIYFPNGFTTGTTEEVTGYFSESCCNPDLKLIVFDRQNNRITRHLNAYRVNLSPGAIAAICLGIVLLIILIIVLVLLCRKCCPNCKKKGSYDLPVYRGPRRT